MAFFACCWVPAPERRLPSSCEEELVLDELGLRHPREAEGPSVVPDAAKPSSSDAPSASSSKIARAAAAWHRQAVDAIWPGAASLFAGLGAALAALHRQRLTYCNPVVDFLFQDAKPAPDADASPSVDGTPTPTAKTPSAHRQPSFASGSSAGRAVLQSLRLGQRGEQDVRIQHGFEKASGIGDFITGEVLDSADLEVLLTRQTQHLQVPEGGPPPELAISGDATPATSVSYWRRQAETSVTVFGISAQLGCHHQLFPALVEGVKKGPMAALAEQGVSGAEVLAGLAQTWPKLSALLRTIFEGPSTKLSASRAHHNCVEVNFSAPLDMSAIAAQYISVAKLLKALKSLRVRITDLPRLEAGQAGQRQALELSMEDWRVCGRILICGDLLAWADSAWKPVLQDGKVVTIEAPLSEANAPEARSLSVYCCIENLTLRLGDFGCIGLNRLSLPDATWKIDISSVPLEGQKPGDGKVIPSVIFSIVEMAPFPIEMLVRPFFDVRLMRALLVGNFEISWVVRPGATGDGWQLVNVLRVALPKVARAFKVCFRSFARHQIRDSDWIILFSRILAAVAEDLRVFEGATES
mmetsp:Transcript_76265/g.171029  ORF Transcript_76265/g.171029 Transcript_76265/m.171029 type:complete len:583 (-) Transcript_76265:62-1810(-)